MFLVFGKLEQRSVACLVPRDSPGLQIEPIHDLMGFRSAGLAQLTFNDVEVPVANVVGKPGFALSHVAPVGLQYGRISTACSALGLLRGCFEESIAYAAVRKIDERTVGEIGMIRALIARMGTDLEAAGLLCHNACRTEDDHLPEVFENTLMAKYFTSIAAVKAASDAVRSAAPPGSRIVAGFAVLPRRKDHGDHRRHDPDSRGAPGEDVCGPGASTGEVTLARRF